MSKSTKRENMQHDLDQALGVVGWPLRINGIEGLDDTEFHSLVEYMIRNSLTSDNACNFVKQDMRNPEFTEVIFKELSNHINDNNLLDLLKLEDDRVDEVVAKSIKNLIHGGNICTVLEKGGVITDAATKHLLEVLNSTFYDFYYRKAFKIGYKEFFKFLTPENIPELLKLSLHPEIKAAIEHLKPNFDMNLFGGPDLPSDLEGPSPQIQGDSCGQKVLGELQHGDS